MKNSNNTDEIKERGAAGINIALEDGVITVRHSENNYCLAQWVGQGNDWNELWERIEELQRRAQMQTLA